MKKVLFTIIFLSLLIAETSAQIGSVGINDAVSTGMARTYNSISRGVYSIGINPANLLLNESEKIDIVTVIPIPRISARVGEDFITMQDINYFFGGVDGKSRYLNDADKERLNSLFENGGTGFTDASISLFSIGYRSDMGAFAFSINDAVAGNFQFPKSVAEIALYGNQQGKEYNLDQTNFKTWWIRDYAFSYARKIFTDGSNNAYGLYAGVSFKIVQGFAYTGTENVGTTISTGNSNEITGNADLRGLSAFSDNFGVKYDFDSTKHSSSFSMFPSPAGSGVGLDLGFTYAFPSNLKISFAVTDMGSIKWTKNAAQFSASGNIYLDDLTNQSQLDTLKDKLLGKSQSIESFTTSLPTAIRFGFSKPFFETNRNSVGYLLVALDYNQGLNDMPGNSKKGRLSIGTEWKPLSWSPFLRTGFSFGGISGFNWAFGLGLDVGLLEFNVATSDFQSFASPNSTKHLSVAFDSRWKF